MLSKEELKTLNDYDSLVDLVLENDYTYDELQKVLSAIFKYLAVKNDAKWPLSGDKVYIPSNLSWQMLREFPEGIDCQLVKKRDESNYWEAICSDGQMVLLDEQLIIDLQNNLPHMNFVYVGLMGSLKHIGY